MIPKKFVEQYGGEVDTRLKITSAAGDADTQYRAVAR